MLKKAAETDGSPPFIPLVNNYVVQSFFVYFFMSTCILVLKIVSSLVSLQESQSPHGIVLYSTRSASLIFDN